MACTMAALPDHGRPGNLPHYSDTRLETRQDELLTQVVGQEWDLVVDIPSPADVLPRFLHAVVSSWFDVDPDQTQSVSAVGPKRTPHLMFPVGHLAASKPYSIGPLWQRPDGRSGFSLRVLGGAVQPPDAPEPIRLGRQSATVDWQKSVLLHQHRVTDLQHLPAVASVLVRFETPLTRRHRRTYHPVPTEQSILASWERTAASLGLGGAVDWAKTDAHITHLNGHTANWPAPKARSRHRDPVGFIGDVALAVAPEHGQRLHQLATLATYTGTGSHTTYGMGFTTLMAAEELAS